MGSIMRHKKISALSKKVISGGLKKAGFSNEKDFSDFLANNFIDEIEDILGGQYSLVNPKLEVPAGGSYKADIILQIEAEEEEEKDSVIIENQFGSSDHGHLGKCITYASNKKAKIVIWICEKFEEPHIKALQWLNEHFKNNVNFYGLEATAYELDDETLLDLVPVVTPLESVYAMESSAKMPRRKKRHEIIEMAREKYNKISPEKITKEHQIQWSGHDVLRKKSLQIRWKDLKLHQTFITELKIRPTSGDMQGLFRKLQQNKEKIEGKIPNLDWRDPKKKDVHQEKPSIRVSVHVPKLLETISDDEMEKITDELAKYAASMTEIVNELEL